MLAKTHSGTNPVTAAAIAVALGGAATVLGAFYFEYGLGLKPCPLCLQQRIAFYVVIPLALIVAAASAAGLDRRLLLAGLAIVLTAMLGNAVLGVYHSGVEWKFWPGPQECAGKLQSFGPAADLLKQLSSARVVRCDEAPWRFLGVSLAGYNVLISLALSAVALWGATARPPRPH
jgi:disulfide bond formation protein DsbB